MTITEQALQLLQRSEATTASNVALLAATASLTGLVALDSNIKVHDFEHKFEHRRRALGCMSTDFVAPFAQYAMSQAHAGCTVFVDAESMTANAVLNFGTVTNPGHCDSRAYVSLKRTAAYQAMLRLAEHQQDQRSFSEWLEEWGHILIVRDGIEFDSPCLDIKQCISAVRSVTIKAAQEAESTVGNFSHNRTAAEQIAMQAKADAKLPPFLHLSFLPYAELTPRTFVLRVSAITSRETPAFRLQVLQLEKHQEEMANEFASVVRKEFDALCTAVDTTTSLEAVQKVVPQVLLGSYTKG